MWLNPVHIRNIWQAFTNSRLESHSRSIKWRWASHLEIFLIVPSDSNVWLELRTTDLSFYRKGGFSTSCSYSCLNIFLYLGPMNPNYWKGANGLLKKGLDYESGAILCIFIVPINPRRNLGKRKLCHSFCRLEKTIHLDHSIARI